MSFTNSNDYLTGRKPVVTPSGPEVVAVRFPLALATGDLALNACGAIGILPAGCVPVSVIVDSDDVDSAGPAVVFAVGLLNDTSDDLSAAWVTGINSGQAGVAAQVVSTTLMRVAPANADRRVGLKVTTAPATAVAGTVGVTLLYRAA